MGEYKLTRPSEDPDRPRAEMHRNFDARNGVAFSRRGRRFIRRELLIGAGHNVHQAKSRAWSQLRT